MKVLFQSHEFAKRSASRFEDAGLDWPLHRRLLALALMFGHDSWESLVATCADGNPKVIFDQDMSQDAFAKRSADMAHGLSIGLDLIYQEAYDIVSFVRPLHDRARPSLPLYVHDEHRAKYQAEEGDTWYVSTQETWHPFTIPGFEMCLSTNLSAMARGRLKKRDLGILWKMPSESPMFRRAVLVPHGFKKPWTQQAVFRVGELMAFEEQPMRWMLRAPSSHPPQVNEWLARVYPNATKQEAMGFLRARVGDLERLRAMAGISKRPRRETIATVAAREAGGVKWHWPLVPLDQGRSAVEQSEALARAEQLRLDRKAGRPVFSVYLPG